MTDPIPQNAVMAVAFSRDGTTVAAGRVDGAVDLWDPPHASSYRMTPGTVTPMRFETSPSVSPTT